MRDDLRAAGFVSGPDKIRHLVSHNSLPKNRNSLLRNEVAAQPRPPLEENHGEKIRGVIALATGSELLSSPPKSPELGQPGDS